MTKTEISWTNYTWNPVHGCSRVSEGCRHCYAERLSLRRGWTKHPWTGHDAPLNVQLKPHKLRERFPTGASVFVNSMSDLFHELIPDDYIAAVFQRMVEQPAVTFQILTKRPLRAVAWPGPWPGNIWMGVSIEDAFNLHRLATLRGCHAAVRFISAEPLIGPWPEDVSLDGIDWLIVGGESGPGFRPMPHAWARRLRDLCIDQRVPFFFKQSAAGRTEQGQALRHEDGTFWTWRQYPLDMADPQPAPAHRYTYE